MLPNIPNNYPKHFEITFRGLIATWRFILNGRLYGQAFEFTDETDREELTDALLRNISDSYDAILLGGNHGTSYTEH